MTLRGVNDDNAVVVRCPKCNKVLLYINRKAKGRIYPFCKKCHSNVTVSMPLESPAKN